MSRYMKRSLIVFSVALNIGFVVASGIIYWKHPSTSHYRYTTFAREFLNELSLSEGEKQSLTECLDGFIKEVSSAGKSLHEVQQEMLMALAAPGVLDNENLEKIYSAQGKLLVRKRRMVLDHFIVMKKLLGDEKSSQFFSGILAKNK